MLENVKFKAELYSWPISELTVFTKTFENHKFNQSMKFRFFSFLNSSINIWSNHDPNCWPNKTETTCEIFRHD